MQDHPGINHSREDDSRCTTLTALSAVTMGRAVQGRRVTSVSQEDFGQPVLQDATPSGYMELTQHCLWPSRHSALCLVPGDRVDGAMGVADSPPLNCPAKSGIFRGIQFSSD